MREDDDKDKERCIFHFLWWSSTKRCYLRTCVHNRRVGEVRGEISFFTCVAGQCSSGCYYCACCCGRKNSKLRLIWPLPTYREGNNRGHLRSAWCLRSCTSLQWPLKSFKTPIFLDLKMIFKDLKVIQVYHFNVCWLQRNFCFTYGAIVLPNMPPKTLLFFVWTKVKKVALPRRGTKHSVFLFSPSTSLALLLSFSFASDKRLFANGLFFFSQAASIFGRSA